MNKMKTKHPNLKPGEEPENFDKIVKTNSGHLAIVDAALLRNLEHPSVKNAVIFSTKQTIGEEQAFRVVGTYDSAILRDLIMMPASIEDEAKAEIKDKKQLDETGRAHEIKKPSGIKKAEDPGYRKKRNKLNKKDNIKSSGKGIKLINPVEKKIGEISQKVQAPGAEHSNYGQPITQNECAMFLSHVKDNTISDEFIDNMEHKYEIFESLKVLRDITLDCKHFDLVYAACEMLESYNKNNISNNTKLIEAAIKKGLSLV